MARHPITILGLERSIVLVDHPAQEAINKWGELAYVSEADRKAILALSFGRFGPACECLRKAIKKQAKEVKKRSER